MVGFIGVTFLVNVVALCCLIFVMGRGASTTTKDKGCCLKLGHDGTACYSTLSQVKMQKGDRRFDVLGNS